MKQKQKPVFEFDVGDVGNYFLCQADIGSWALVKVVRDNEGISLLSAGSNDKANMTRVLRCIEINPEKIYKMVSDASNG